MCTIGSTLPNEMCREGYELSIQPVEDEVDDDLPDATHKPVKLDDFPSPEIANAHKPEATPQIEGDEDGKDTTEEMNERMDDLGLMRVFNEALNYERAAFMPQILYLRRCMPCKPQTPTPLLSRRRQFC